MTRKTLSLLAVAALLACGACKKNKAACDDCPTSSSSGAVSSGEAAAEFPSTDASYWVNGAPVKLGELRGDVVLVEAWHRQ